MKKKSLIKSASIKRRFANPKATIRAGKTTKLPTRFPRRTFGEVLKNPTAKDREIYAAIDRHMQGILSHNKSMGRMYDAAVTTNLNLDFPIDITDANAQIFNSIISVRSRARTVERDDPYAHNAVEAYMDDVGGEEPFKLEMNVGKKNASGEFKAEDDTNEEIEKAWQKAGRPENCCANGSTSRSEMDWMAIASLVRDGGVLFQYHDLYPYNDFKFAIEPKEIDYLDSYYSRPNYDNNASEIQFSIQVDKKYKRVQGYWLFTRHPGAIFTGFSPQVRREFVPVEKMSALFDIRTRAGQYVGMSRLASIIQRLHRIDQFNIAHVTAAIWNSCNPIFFTMEFPTAMEMVPDFIKTAMNQINEIGQGSANIDGQGFGFGIGQKYNNMEPGTASTIPYGYKPIQLDSKFPAQSAVGFNEDETRAAAVGCQIPMFRFTGDYSKTNFSSGKLGFMSWHDTCERLQQHIITNYRRPHFEKWLYNALLTGQIKQPMSRYQEFCDAAVFFGRRWDDIQPFQKAQTDILNLEAGLTSPTRIIRDSPRGGDARKLAGEISADRKAYADHKLDFTGDVSTPTIKKGAPMQAQPDPDIPGEVPAPGSKPAKEKTICGECGTRSHNGEAVCQTCFNPLPEPPKVRRVKKSCIWCMECGSRANEGDEICEQCGSDSVTIYKEALLLHASRR